MWELGVRHALKPHHTIMICEKEQMSSIPFDVNHFMFHHYTHSEEGIPYKEVARFKAHLKEVINGLLNQEPKTVDSPVHLFLKEELAQKNTPNMIDKNLVSEESFASIIQKAEEAKNKKEFKNALVFLAIAKKGALQNMTLKDNLAFIISRQALCTYKLKEPNELEAFVKAKTILDKLNPESSQDIEVLGLSGAIHKRLYEITGKLEYLETAVQFYEKGFQLKQDYYNGINTAFMLYQKASIQKQENKPWEDTKLKADYIRNCVLEITLALETKENFIESTDAVWVLFTIAEAYNYKKDTAKQVVYEQKAIALAKSRGEDFAIGSYDEQKGKIEVIFEKIKP
jgi:tetratricopeptide (TPR) repeat protein